jgi:cyclic pyranopterin phosphate synthase
MKSDHRKKISPGSNASTSARRGLTHLSAEGRTRMVDIGAKEVTVREAVARGRISMSEATIGLLKKNALPKGNALESARLAGILAAKKTAELIPLCHPLGLDFADLKLTPHADGIEIESTARCTGKTGVEMEALTAVSIAALTLYDMCKAVDKMMVIGEIRLIKKSGGRSGEFVRPTEET